MPPAGARRSLRRNLQQVRRCCGLAFESVEIRLGLAADVIKMPHCSPREVMVLVRHPADPAHYIVACLNNGEWVELEQIETQRPLFQMQESLAIWGMILRDLIWFTHKRPTVLRMHAQHFWADALEEVLRAEAEQAGPSSNRDSIT